MGVQVPPRTLTICLYSRVWGKPSRAQSSRWRLPGVAGLRRQGVASWPRGSTCRSPRGRPRRRAVAGHLACSVLDPGRGGLCGDMIGMSLLAGHDLVDGAGEAGRGKHGGEPVVDLRVEGVLPQVDVARVADFVGKRVLGSEPAAVVGRGVDPVSF